MRCIGNYNSWINDDWICKVLTTPGQARPRDWPPASYVENYEYQKSNDAGYDLNAVYWWVYEKQDLGINIDPPWVSNKYHWWITKLYPGQFMPVHTDPHTYDQCCRRFWIPMQDYHPGHIFLYKDTIIVNYKKGDVYVYDHENDIHGAANIGHIPRLALQVTEYI